MGPGICPRCGRQADELHDAAVVGGVCCERCYLRAAPRSKELRRYKPPPPPPRSPDPQPGSYEFMVDYVWTRLEALTGMPVFSLPEPGRIAAHCPVGCGGVLSIKFVTTIDGPEAIIDSAALGLGLCSNGCNAEQILGALA